MGRTSYGISHIYLFALTFVHRLSCSHRFFKLTLICRKQQPTKYINETELRHPQTIFFKILSDVVLFC